MFKPLKFYCKKKKKKIPKSEKQHTIPWSDDSWITRQLLTQTNASLKIYPNVYGKGRSILSNIVQDKIFRRKHLGTGASFVHVYLEIWGKGILKFNKFPM